MRQLLLAAAASPFLGSCIAVHNTPGVVLATDPPGARILIDGKDTGYVTPCDLGVERKRQRIDLVLDGYQTASRLVEEDGRWYLIFWDESTVPNTWNFPLWLNIEDCLAPIKYDHTYWPQRVFVRMKLAGAE
jgi:hypothetical protein